MAEPHFLGRRALAGTVVIAAVALGVRLIGLDHTPHFDELFHVLAGRAYSESGTLTLPGGGPYERAWAFTLAIAAMFRLAGESLVVARLPSVLAGTALVVLLFSWVRAEAGALSGWIAGALLCFDPAAIYFSQLARFYSWHALFTLLAAVAVYRLTRPPYPRGARLVSWCAVTVLALMLAQHLQILTLVAAGALALWLLLILVPLLYRRWTSTWGRLALAAACVGVLAAGAWLVTSGSLFEVWNLVQYVDMWAVSSEGQLKYYHWLLLDRYPALWTAFPLLLLAAATRWLRATLFCALVFSAGFVFHSLAAWKVERYFFWALPMFFAIVGMGLAVALPAVVAAVQRPVAAIAGPRLGPRACRYLATISVIAGLSFAIGAGGSFRYTMSMLLVDDSEWTDAHLYRGESDWEALARRLGPLIEQADVVAASAGPKALYFLGRSDVILSATELYDPYGTAEEFSADTTPLARPVISRAESLQQIFDCHGRGLIVVENKHWNKVWSVPTPLSDRIASLAREVPVDPAWRLRAFTWDNPAARSDCELSWSPAR